MALLLLGAVGQRLNISVGGLQTSLVEYSCMGSERNLSNCINSALPTCNVQSVATVRCQGT